MALVPEHRVTPKHTEVAGLDHRGSSQDQSWWQKTIFPGVSASQRRPEDIPRDVTAIQDIPSGTRKETGEVEVLCFLFLRRERFLPINS